MGMETSALASVTPINYGNGGIIQELTVDREHWTLETQQLGDPTTSVRGGSSKIPSEGVASGETRECFIGGAQPLRICYHSKKKKISRIDLLIYTTKKIQLYIYPYRKESILWWKNYEKTRGAWLYQRMIKQPSPWLVGWTLDFTAHGARTTKCPQQKGPGVELWGNLGCNCLI